MSANILSARFTWAHISVNLLILTFFKVVREKQMLLLIMMITVCFLIELTWFEANEKLKYAYERGALNGT